MASTFVNNLRLTELGTGDASGTWGNTTNTNLELIGQALGFGTRAIANASTDNITIADGASDADRSMYLKLTGGGQACTVTLLPNTVSKVWIIENTTNSTLTFTQGSGANVAILTGQTKAIATDGGASGAIVYEVFTDLNLSGVTYVDDLEVGDDLIVTDDITCGGSIDLEGDIDVNGTMEADAMTLNGTAITTTATLSTGISNTNVPVFTSGVADDDFLRVAGTSIEGRSAAEVLSDIGASAVAGSGSIVTTGALNSGSITSGFGTIDTGSSTITTTGTVSTGAITAGGDITRGGTVILDGSITDTGDFTLDVAGDIVLDADGQEIFLKNGGVHWGTFLTDGTPNSFYIDAKVSDGDMILRGNDGGSTVNALTLDMSAAGAATFNNDVTAFSDKRLKTDISNIENGLDKVMQMQGVYYKRNDVEDAREQIGVLAQDMEAIMPEVVLTADDEMQTKSVDYGKLTSVLIEAIKELKLEIDELKKG
jgi:hypothetical protein